MAKSGSQPEAANGASQKERDVRNKALDIAVAQIEKEFGKGTIMRLGEQTHLDVPSISTGALALDIALGVGGLPRGRVVEVFGPESSGKTTLCLHVVANAQRAGGVGAFIDVEHALDPSYARRIGVNLEELLISQPDAGEDALNIAETLVRSNAVDVLVIDSVAALVPRAELEGQMGVRMWGMRFGLWPKGRWKLKAVHTRPAPCSVSIKDCG